MNKFNTLTLYALIVMLSGINMIILLNSTTLILRYSISIGFLLGAIFSLITGYQFKKLNIPSTYHFLHSIGMFIYVLSLLFYANNMEKFLNCTTFYLVYYGFSEIIFSFQITELRQRNINTFKIIYRIISGIFIIACGATILQNNLSSQQKPLLIAGIVIIISGINLLVFKTVMQNETKPI